MGLKFLPGNHDYPGYSLFKIILWKLGVLYRLSGELKLLCRVRYFHKISSFHKLKNKFAGTAVICGTGPSLNSLSTEDKNIIAFAKTNGALFGIGNFIETPIGARFPPNFVAMLDAAYFSSENLGLRTKYLNSGTNFVIQKIKNEKYLDPVNSIWIPGLVAPTFTKNINPLFPCGFPDYSILFTISVALYLGFKRVFLFGADANQHKYLEINNDGKLVIQPSHAYRESQSQRWVGRSTVVQALNSNVVFIDSLKVFKRKKVFVVGNYSYIDTLERITSKDALIIIKNNQNV